MLAPTVIHGPAPACSSRDTSALRPLTIVPEPGSIAAVGDRGWFQTLVRANGTGVNCTGGIVPEAGGVVPDVGGVVPDSGEVPPVSGEVVPDDGVVVVPDTGAEGTGEPGLNGAVVGSGGGLACA